MPVQIADEGSECLSFWSALRRSAEGLYPGYAELADLRFALDEGWIIEPPVYVYREEGWRPYCHILLRRAERQVLLSLPESDVLRRFLEEQRVPLELRSISVRAKRSARARRAG
ncbi:hypothetical protein [Thermoflexus sp.]|uniref:hypothetical protein n=1 Tax=Thermoflexus sp. TaxID=1969742 RepID=UPI0017568858|nr:hypothetical protein [Thermoflexus sp.]